MKPLWLIRRYYKYSTVQSNTSSDEQGQPFNTPHLKHTSQHGHYTLYKSQAQEGLYRCCYIHLTLHVLNIHMLSQTFVTRLGSVQECRSPDVIYQRPISNF